MNFIAGRCTEATEMLMLRLWFGTTRVELCTDVRSQFGARSARKADRNTLLTFTGCVLKNRQKADNKFRNRNRVG